MPFVFAANLKKTFAKESLPNPTLKNVRNRIEPYLKTRTEFNQNSRKLSFLANLQKKPKQKVAKLCLIRKRDFRTFFIFEILTQNEKIFKRVVKHHDFLILSHY